MDAEPARWNISSEYAVRSKFKRYNKKHPREYAACFENLDRLQAYLDDGYAWNTFQFGFLRSEGNGLYRVGETGIAHARGTRLYVYVSEAERTIYVISIGDKDTQQGDLGEAKEILERLKKEHQDEQGQAGSGEARR